MNKNKENKITPEQRVTDKIINLIENNQTENGIDWVKVGMRIHHRHDGKAYNLLNSMILSEEAERCEYKNSQWLTFNQIKKLDGNVKGKKSTYITLSFPIFEKDGNGKFVFNTKGEKQIKGFRRSGVGVFNIEQTGITPDQAFNIEKVELEELVVSQMTSNFVDNFPTPIRFDGGNKAFYRPSTNSIHLPKEDQFDSNESLLSVMFHEAAHSTGHKDWLDRDGITGGHKFGSSKYAFEELVAEITSAMICSKYGIEYKMAFHASYIESWLKVLKNDTKAIFKASAQATKACDEISNYLDTDKEELKKVA
jgi:antirestriction protein ArdC